MKAKAKKILLSVPLKGKGIWMDTAGKTCKVSEYDFNGYVHGQKNKCCNLKVYHNLPWGIYTDETFENEITKFLKKKHPEMKIDYIHFSEQGLQEDGVADMDVNFK